VRSCPNCNVTLNLLTGQDGWGVEPTVDATSRRRVMERRVLANVYACPRCEHIEEGSTHVSHEN
jgi:hypothetical protein